MDNKITVQEKNPNLHKVAFLKHQRKFEPYLMRITVQLQTPTMSPLFPVQENVPKTCRVAPWYYTVIIVPTIQ